MSLWPHRHAGAAEPGADFLPKLSVRKGKDFPSTPPRWSESRAKKWFAAQPWRQGANFLPSSASNQFEMFQAETFDEATISRELGWAAGLNYNAVRVFLHNAMWSDDANGFLKRVDTFLRIADSHGIGTMLVLFDGCWDPHPKLGKQPEPRPRVHNSRWVQAPGAKILADPAAIDKLEGYVKDVVGRYANDSRVLLFDLFNEPDNANAGSYSSIGDRVPSAEDALGKELQPLVKAQSARSLIAKALQWSREIGPSQPLTVGVYWAPSGDEEADRYRGETGGWVLGVVDVTTFHNYDVIRGMATEVLNLKSLGRPVICTEYMSRGTGSTFDPILGYLRCEPAAQACLTSPCSLCTRPLRRSQDVWAFNWGFVAGRSQTNYPWDSWQVQYTEEPAWFHDVLRIDGSAYDAAEHAYLRNPVNTFLVRNIMVTSMLVIFLVASTFASVACFWHRDTLFKAVPKQEDP